METKKSRLSWGGMALLLCGMYTLTSLFLAPGPRALAATPAFVRIIHASPFVATADIFVDGSPFLTSFGFGAVTDYKAVPPGSHKVQIALEGKGIAASALTQVFSVQPGMVYTVVATGTSASTLALKAFIDSNLATSGNAKVRMYQLSPDGGWMSIQANSKYMTGASYLQDSGYFTLSAGSVTFTLDSAAAGKSLSMSMTLPANTVTSVFAVGMFHGNPKAELVSAQTTALPGLPQTGSDPYAVVSNSNGPFGAPWLLIALAALVVGGTLLTWRLFARGKG
jgi:hypothetical protein